MRRVEVPLLLAVLCAAPQTLLAGQAPPEDEFLEYLGAFDEAWVQACDPDGYLPGDDACEHDDDEHDDDEHDDEN